MREHLTDEELTEVLDGMPEGDTLAHLAGCETCRAERDRLRVELAAFAEQTRAGAERSEASWDRQRRRIVGRLVDRPSPALGWYWAWAPAVLLIVILGWFWFAGWAPHPSSGPEADHALLISVERSIRADVPQALRPAALLAAQLEQGPTQP